MNIYQPYDRTQEIHFYQYFQTDNDNFSFDFDVKLKDFRYLVVSRMHVILENCDSFSQTQSTKTEINVYENILEHQTKFYKSFSVMQ